MSKEKYVQKVQAISLYPPYISLPYFKKLLSLCEILERHCLRSDGLAPQLVDDALLLGHFVVDDGQLAEFSTENHGKETVKARWKVYRMVFFS